jgi:hypothetical protein
MFLGWRRVQPGGEGQSEQVLQDQNNYIKDTYALSIMRCTPQMSDDQAMGRLTEKLRRVC